MLVLVKINRLLADARKDHSTPLSMGELFTLFKSVIGLNSSRHGEGAGVVFAFFKTDLAGSIFGGIW